MNTSSGLKVLLLGGTRDAINIANALLELNKSGEHEIELIYSVAGIVRQPSVNCTIHKGGFSQYAVPLNSDHLGTANNKSQQGMKHFLQQHDIEYVIDATHPYALTMSTTASIVCESLTLPLLTFCRPQWQPMKNDNWITVNNWSEAKVAMHPFSRPFVTIGRIAVSEVNSIPGHQFWTIRSAIEDNEILDRYRLIKDIGPFEEAHEKTLMQTNNIDVVVCKNSGGSSVDGKLKAARALQLPVIMLNRPKSHHAYGEYYNHESDLISALINRNNH